LEIKQEQCFENDELKIYRGEDFVVSKHIIIHQPTLGQIADYGERDYWSLVYNFTATPQSMKAPLWDMQPSIDYTEITPYQLFYTVLYKIFPQEKTSILFGDLDFSKFQLMQRKDNESILLYQEVITGDIYNHDNELLFHFNNLYEAERLIGYEKDSLLNELIVTNGVLEDYIFSNLEKESIIIDEYTYGIIIDYLCKSHFIKQDLKIPANNSTKMILIEDARDELEKNKNKKYHSQLKNLISAMINSEGFKYNHSQVWDMKINAFMDSVKRIGKIKNADLLMQSGCSGFGVNLKEINKNQLDWLGELE
jgi:hypothetical protein